LKATQNNNDVTLNAISDVLNSILFSYSQVFFSKNRFFAVILLVVTFFDVFAGMAGLMAVIVVNVFAIVLGMNKEKVSSGSYGFNALLVGLGIGIYYQPSVEFYIVLLFISMLTLFFTIGLEGVLAKYGLPYLSIPFLIGIWMVIIATRGYASLKMSERGIYDLNEMYTIGGMAMVQLYEWFNALAIFDSLRIYFKSLSAILFQYHLFAGILLAAGLLYYSRIAFLLSLIGFFTAYYFYLFIGADISELSYSYIGFNYILTSIAVGGFFIVPSKRSVLWVVLLTPLVAITISSTSYLFSFYGLSIFSLPFNIIVILFLYVLKFREKRIETLSPVNVQLYSPEKHVYNYDNYMSRFGTLPWYAMKLPFWGEWKVTQGYNGEHTHKEGWRYAWDFEIADEEGNVHDTPGNQLKDFYGFNKPVTAPADGVIEEVEDGIEDNRVGDMNLEKNWGNSVVIKHAEGIYSQLSHLKMDSIQVVKDQEVKQGELIAYCGNSGRSPVPHIHMQFQTNPNIGSETIKYPFSAIVLQKNKTFQFETVAIPEQDQVVSNPVRNEMLYNAYHFIPGQLLHFEVLGRQIGWLVESDMYKNTYLLCQSSGAKAYFKQLGNVFYFTSYTGKKDELLYYFFLSSFKIVTAYYKGMKITDSYPLSLYSNKMILLLQDFCAPFWKFLTTRFELVYESFNEKGENSEMILSSKAYFGRGKLHQPEYEFTLGINQNGIEQLIIKGKGKNLEAIRTFK
jgi:urea transporter